MVQAYRLLAEMGDWPLHLGVTEAGPAFQGTIKSATAFGILLGEGIGDTIRVSLSAPPAEEVKVGHQILQSLNLRERKLEIVSCPSCGRAQVDVYTLADDVTEGLKDMTVPLRVAVMGCVVNGPGEAREADLGVASGNGKGQIFVKGQVIKTVPESEIVATLIEEANRLAAEMGPDAPVGTAQVVTSLTPPPGARALSAASRPDAAMSAGSVERACATAIESARAMSSSGSVGEPPDDWPLSPRHVDEARAHAGRGSRRGAPRRRTCDCRRRSRPECESAERDAGRGEIAHDRLDRQRREVGVRRRRRCSAASTGCAPSLSGMRASMRFTATRSTEISARPPARPVAITMSGECSTIEPLRCARPHPRRSPAARR